MAGLCPQTTGKTSSDGSFHFESVYPATYLVTASGMPGLVSIRTSQMEADIDPKHSISDLVLKLAPEYDPRDEFILYSPGTLRLEEAVPIHVEIGQTFAGVDLHFRPIATFRIQGRAQMETIGVMTPGKLELHLDAHDNSGVTAAGREITLDPNGNFEADVLPGAYTLRLIGTTTLSVQAGGKDAKFDFVHLLAKENIEVRGKDLLGLTLLIPQPSTINGQVRTEGTAKLTLANSKVILRPVEPFVPSGQQTAEVQPDGSFTLTNCDAANYAVHFSPPSGTYVSSILFNQVDAMTHLIDLSKGTGGELIIVVRTGSASIMAAVQGSNKLLDVALIPDTWTADELAPVMHAVSKDGNYSVTEIPPGHYTAVATTDIEQHLWQNAEFVHAMQAKGVGIDLAENDQKNVFVTLLPADDVDAIELQLGFY